MTTISVVGTFFKAIISPDLQILGTQHFQQYLIIYQDNDQPSRNHTPKVDKKAHILT
jgi:hypothetical protein